MAFVEETQSPWGTAGQQAASLAREWRRMTRAATAVALLTAPAFFLILLDSNHLSFAWSLTLTAVAVVAFRGLVEVIVRRFIPWPSLLGSDETLKQEDIVARRRWWFWRGKWRRLPFWIALVLLFLGVCQALFAFTGTSAPFFDPFKGLRQLYPASELPQLLLLVVQLPFFFLFNALILMGPFVWMSFRAIRSYEPGDASWGVKLEDVRGQAEAKDEIARVITLWQSGDEFEQAGGKRERGLLFLGAPGTGKTMISKAIATSFNCPFVTIPGSGFAQMFIGMDVITVQLLARRARKLARKWGGQCIVFIDEIDAVGMRRQSLGTGATVDPVPTGHAPDLFFGPLGSISASGDVVIESREWRERLFAQRASSTAHAAGPLQRLAARANAVMPGMFGGYGGQALNSLLVVMDGMGEPSRFKKWFVNRVNTWLDALFVVPQKLGSLALRLPAAKPQTEQIYFIGACNVPLEVLDPALIRPGRMGRHIYFRTPTKDDRKDIFDVYLSKVDHEPDLDLDRRRDELARITSGYSPAMIEQVCSMALTIAHAEGRKLFAWRDIVEAMTTVEAGTAQNIEYVPEETRAIAIHEAGHAAAGHVFLGEEVESTRLSIRKRGGSLGHYMSMERDERFSHFRSYVTGRLAMILGAMAAEHVFYGENSQGVSGDLYSATATAAWMVGMWGMGPDARAIDIAAPAGHDQDEAEVVRRLQRIGSAIMNRASTGSMMSADPIASVLGDRDKRANAAQLLGEAYVSAYSLMATNREAIERIADELVERKEMHGDEVVALLDSVGLVRPQIDLTDDHTWPKI